ncbi:MAG: CRISPR-associated endonuclease Cas2 [Xanthomonadaceae bacterium]|nr:CRISPR-associated endonuclease Cas2 [Xanthomonadaceae bacterium]MDP2185420.1 CRISPR-associated endonuclease Cas2 [Xanthomonadales bacterium]MDZ4116814.1 CRISPR-associated endonuclease Cas2 [Xanthomonadaceae bacterium]MDZ4379199.1 CRISPR-associated endonuclease Cas2 [Xanthomonadaceae bacterium]
MHRQLHLLAYDIADPRRLARIGRIMRGYKAQGQKSFCECWLTAGERTRLLRILGERIDPRHDRIHCLQLDPRRTPVLFGRAQSALDQYFLVS